MASLSGVGSGELVTTVKKLKFVSQEKGNKSFELFIPEIVVEKCHFSLIAEHFLGAPKSIETAQNNLLLASQELRWFLLLVLNYRFQSLKRH